MVDIGKAFVKQGFFLQERVAMKYPADLSLAAMMNGFGTFQTLIVAALMERNPSSWRISWDGSLQLPAILYGVSHTKSFMTSQDLSTIELLGGYLTLLSSQVKLSA